MRRWNINLFPYLHFIPWDTVIERFAKEFKTEFVSSSIMYSSGSNKFGDTLDDLHRFTGSLETTSSTLTIDSVAGDSGSIN